MPNHPDHICRFNDGECSCECYDKGFETGLLKGRNCKQNEIDYHVEEAKSQERKELIEWIEGRRVSIKNVIVGYKQALDELESFINKK